MDDDDYAISKMKDFLYIFNRMSENCFNHCVENFNCRDLTPREESCVEKCSSKGVAVNHKLMMSYIDVQPEILNKRAEEMERQQQMMNASKT